jgi:hypothetical protein
VRTAVPRAFVALATLGVHGFAAACASTSIPDPREAVGAYAAAASRADAAALYRMMTRASQRDLSLEQVRSRVADERAELVEQARGLTGEGIRVEATAQLRFADGEEASLEFRDGRYWVASAGALPGGGRTPREALEQLRRVLARRSYDGLIRVLSAGTRAAVEGDVRGLLQGLSDPEALHVNVDGDEARIPVPGGHMVTLKREGRLGLWHVQDFD